MNSKSKLLLELIRRDFSFLMSQYDFSITNEKSQPWGEINYENNDIYINIYYAPPGYELDIIIGHKKITTGKYTFGLQNLADISGVNYSFGFSAYSEDNLRKVISLSSTLLQKIGGPYLRGDEQHFRELMMSSDKRDREQEHKELIKSLALEISNLWGEKDYKRLEKLLNRNFSILTESQKKKLSLIEK